MTHGPPPVTPQPVIAPAVLSRLAFAAAARTASDFARGLVPAQPGRTGHGGLLVADAVALTKLAHTVLAAAVLAELDAGAGWDDIADGLNLDPDTARARYAQTVEQRRTDLARAAVDRAAVTVDRAAESLEGLGFPAVLADQPVELARELDQWVTRHHKPDDPVDHEDPLTKALNREPR